MPVDLLINIKYAITFSLSPCRDIVMIYNTEKCDRCKYNPCKCGEGIEWCSFMPVRGLK